MPSKPENTRALADPTPETREFWDGTRQHQLRISCCDDCSQTFFPPRPFCPHCGCRDVAMVQASGKATLYSYVISHLPAPGLPTPHVVAVVTLEEGPRMMTNIVDCPASPETLTLDMPLEVVFETASENITLPLFKPAGVPDET